MKKQLLLLLCLLSITINYAQTFNDGVLEYTVISGTDVSVKRYNNVCPTGILDIPGTVIDNGTTYTITSIEYGAFEDCFELTSVTIPNSVTGIEDLAFYSCSALTSINIPNSVISIGSYSFESSGLTSVIIPDSVITIGNDAFFDCGDLTSITLSNSLLSIENSTFTDCGSLTSIIIPDSVTSIGNDVFSFCDSLTSIIIPDSVTSIGIDAFSDCSGLTSVTLSNSLTSIQSNTFSDCSSLTDITIPNSVTSIGTSAFSNCSSLTSLTIPNSVMSIGDNTFAYCSGLTSVTVDWATPLVVPTGIFLNVPVENIPLTVPDGTIDLYQTAEVWQDFGSFVLSTEDFTKNNVNVTLFPNPVHNQLNITINSELSLEKILIYNNLGQLLIESKKPTIDVSKLQGVHFVQIVTNKGTATKKIIVK